MKVEVFKCFVASPGDTERERVICDDVFDEINDTLGKASDFRIESLKWENDARPAFGQDGQAIINEQLLVDFQLFIGIMWGRFGTETERAGSGTEEEFLQAYERFKLKKDIQIMFYFNDAGINPSKIELDQLEKVNAFREKVKDLGGLYWVYVGEAEFKRLLKKHVYDHFVDLYKSKSSSGHQELSVSGSDTLMLKETVHAILKARLNDALSFFADQPIIWVEPVLSRTNKISSSSDENFKNRVDINDFIRSPKSIIIKAPPQFGLTCLSHYMVLEAWKIDSVWVYLDAEKIKKDQIEKSVNKALVELNLVGKTPGCIILDSWKNTEPGAMKLLRNLSNAYRSVPILVMQTIDDSKFQIEDSGDTIQRHFDVWHLIALPRHQIRGFVSAYNTEKYIGDDDKVLTKIIDDLEVLNIHRTPHNCITLLKVFESFFDESPVNRTKMLEMVLQVLFDYDDLPTYKSQPDIKDCEFVLGAFCERLIRSGDFLFSHDLFVRISNEICAEKLIHLDSEIVFNILYKNNIITKRESDYVFRASYWIYYFAAKRMYVDKEFCSYMLSEERYTNFPEVVEFYSGIDRNRSDLLDLIYNDIKCTSNMVQSKTGLTGDINPLQSLEWKPSEDNLEKLRNEISGNVLKSKLPSIIKDQYADKAYDQLKPYDQNIQAFFRDYSLANLWLKVGAASRALRNSDYVDSDLKRKLLFEILRGWEEVSKILFALSPILALRGHAAYEGRSFNLSDGFKGTQEEITKQIYLVIPHNVVNFFRHDIFSNKMGPLLFDAIATEKNSLLKHQLILLIIYDRPYGWKKVVEKYINEIPFNSFYLANVVIAMRSTYKFDFATDKDLMDLAQLLKMGYAKYEFEVKKPSLVEIKKISNKVIPKREFDHSESEPGSINSIPIKDSQP